MKDVRTPTTYFQRRNSTPALTKLKRRLDELLTDLYALKESTDTTLATKKIVDMEIEKAEWERYKRVSRDNATRVVEALTHGTREDAVDALWEALDYKAFCRVEPYLVKTGEEIEEDLFWCNQYGHK
tara:strand:- start:22 stop:402 length:381 start_codon:yes stop_codon:yes gene_type:complete